MRMIFHAAQELRWNARSASGIRPVKMLEAFRSVGCEVDVVSGPSWGRKNQIKEIKRRIRAGVKYDFLYSESSTMPVALTDKHHLPVRPFLEFRFFRFCRRYGIPVALFYRDVYWRFRSYGRELRLIKRVVARLFYWLEIIQYRFSVDLLYLPSRPMTAYVPVYPVKRMKPLPPGCAVAQRKDNRRGQSSNLRVLYIGGIGAHYRLEAFFRAVASVDNVRATICTRREEWARIMATADGELIPTNMNVVHASGDELLELYADADICSLLVEPTEYWQFAAPMKLFEYLGHGKPVVATGGTFAGDFVAENGFGWSIDYESDTIATFLRQLSANPDEVAAKSANARLLANEHTWEKRAREMESDAAKLRTGAR